MKKCESCGAYISEFDRFCPHCGQASTAEKTGTERTEDPVPAAKVSLEKDTEKERTPEPAGTAYKAPDPERTVGSLMPMKWHRFQMVVMIIGAVLTIISGITQFSGGVYVTEGMNAADVYAAYPGMATVDKIYGIAMIVIGVFQIYVRNRLKQYRKDGPKMLMILYAVALAANVIYMAGTASALSISTSEVMKSLDTSTQVQVFRPVIFALINGVYYHKRRDLFTE